MEFERILFWGKIKQPDFGTKSTLLLKKSLETYLYYEYSNLKESSLSSIFNDWFVIDGYYWNNSSRCIYWTARSMERSIFYIYSEKLSLFFIYFQYLFNACQCLIKVCGEFLVFIDSTSYRQPIPNQELDRGFWPDFKVNFQIQKILIKASISLLPTRRRV